MLQSERLPLCSLRAFASTRLISKALPSHSCSSAAERRASLIIARAIFRHATMVPVPSSLFPSFFFFVLNLTLRPVTAGLFFPVSPLPQTAGEWAQVLQLQRQFHQAQLSKWQQILQSSVTLLDQVGVFLFMTHTTDLFSYIPTWALDYYVCIIVSLILYISDEAVFRKAPHRYRGPGAAAGCS